VAHQFFDPFPKYLQIREILMRRIDHGMSVGDRFPTEQALGAQFGVSRETVREALRGLEEDKLISRSPGRGTFLVRKPPARTEMRLTGLAEDLTDLHFATEARVVERGPVTPPTSVAEAMIPRRQKIAYRILRKRWVEGAPFACHEAFLPLEVGARVAALDLRHTSIVHELRVTLHLDIWEDQQRIEAIAADSDLAQLLEVPLGSPLLRISRHFLSDGGRSIVFFRSSFRADRYYYTIKVAQPSTPPTRKRTRARPA
jgi:GntR family transcriptional regulator